MVVKGRRLWVRPRCQCGGNLAGEAAPPAVRRCGRRRRSRARGEDEGHLFLRCGLVKASTLEDMLPLEGKEELYVRPVDSAGMSAPV